MTAMGALQQLTDLGLGLYRLSTFRMPSQQLNTSIGRLIQETAERYPDAPMIVVPEDTWSWSRFNRRANQFARALVSVGIEKGDCVAIHVENTPECLAAMVGAAKAGAVSALLSPSITGRALLHSLESVAPVAILAGPDSVPTLSGVHPDLAPELANRCYFVGRYEDGAGASWTDSLSVLADAQPVDNLARTLRLHLHDTAYYIFTSGTTGGLPKAVIVRHFFWYRASYAFSHLLLHSKRSDRIFVCLPMFHTAPILIGLGVCAQSGCSMYLAKTFSASRFLRDARQYRTNVFLYIGELCRYLLNTPPRPDDADNPIEKIIGNGLRPEIWGAFCDRFGIRRVGEYYGSTEGTTSFMNILNRRSTIGVCLTAHHLVAYDRDNDTEVRGEDGLCHEARQGEPGLLVTPLTEKTQFAGYTDRAETRRKILNDVFEPGDRFFNSGDLLSRVNVGWAFFLPHYQFVDRVGETFRWKGVNTSTSDVAEVINAAEGVDVSCVYGVRIPGTDGRAGMAAIQGDADAVRLDSVVRQLRNHLPSESWPVFVRIVERLDYTPTHKIKKADLKADAFDRSTVSDPLYVLRPDRSGYEPLTESLHRSIVEARHRF